MTSSPRNSSLRRPLIGVVLAFLTGIATGVHRPVAPPVIAALAGVLCLLTFLWASRPISTVTLLISVFLIGWWRAADYVGQGMADTLRTSLKRDREGRELQLCVLEAPQLLRDEKGRVYGRRFAARVEAVRDAIGWLPAGGIVSVSWRARDEAEPPCYGQRWRVSGVVERQCSQFTWWGPAHRMRINSPGERYLPDRSSIFVRFCYRLRDIVVERLSWGLPEGDVSANFVRALFLGDRTHVDERVRDAFASTGLLHVLAVSGLHVGLLVYAMLVAFQFVGLPRRSASWIVVPLLCVYSVMVGLRASVVRASIMSAILLVAMAVRRRPDGLSALALAALLILAICPAQCLDPAFLLSFAAMLALLLISPRMMTALANVGSFHKADDEYTVDMPGTRWSVARMIAYRTASMMVASVAVWLMTAPLIARWFHVFSPVALLGNLLVIPLAFLILCAAMLSLLSGCVHPWLGELFNFANLVLVRVLLGWVHGMACVPGAFWRVASWPIEWTVGWYGLVFLMLTARGIMRRATLFAAGLMVLVMTSGAVLAMRHATLCLLEPTESGAVLIKGPWKRHVLFNAGPEFLAPRVVQSLHDHGVSSLDALVLAEPDAEHVGGVETLLRNMSVREVWCSPWVCASKATMSVLSQAQRYGVRIRRLAAGELVYVGPIGFEVFYPDGGQAVGRRAESLVLRAQWGRGSVLLAGGASLDVQRTILTRFVDPAAEMVIMSGRDSQAGFLSDWVDAVRPRRVLISTGSEGRWIEPSPSFIQALRVRGIEVLRADREGEMVFAWLPDSEGAVGFRRINSLSGSEPL